MILQLLWRIVWMGFLILAIGAGIGYALDFGLWKIVLIIVIVLGIAALYGWADQALKAKEEERDYPDYKNG